ncbi:MAG: VCBS repeat-containing protein, partial [Opitutaceae bacterium]|nr:VCBS repeat-containing protein [Opitutaceae bacterium]
FNGDGHLDLFLGGRVIPGSYPDAPRSALLAWRDGRFVDVTATVAPTLPRLGMVTAALWTDATGDGRPDLVVACDWGRVSCFRNDGAQGFTDITESAGFASAGTGWWRALAAVDLNGDGRPDFVAGNIGLNTRYRASASEPALLYAGVALDGARPQLIEAHYADGRIYPWVTREVITRLFPTLAPRFPTGDSYAPATLDEVFPATALGAARRLEATQLQSGAFLSQADGRWVFTPLPRELQIAPITALAVADFDGDGHADLVAAGNDFTPLPEIGRFDGGLGWLLRGDPRAGPLGLTTVWPRESGLQLFGDVRSVVTTDLDRDGKPDLFVTRNNAPSLAFASRRPSIVPAP